MEYVRVSIIGAGHLAHSLAIAWELAGHAVVEIYSRNLDNALQLANRLYETHATGSLDFTESDADAFVICVADDAIAEVASKIVLPEGKLLIHTSGSRSIDELGDYDGPKGVLYPLQTFSKHKPARWEGVPICLELDDEAYQSTLINLAQPLSKELYWMSYDERLSLHVAAVFACNFTNHLFALAENILAAEDIPFTLLKPLVRETIEKAFSLGPSKSQTGPAIRGDVFTLALHQTYLADNPELANLYRQLSASIQANASES